MPSVISELARRRVFRVGGIYIVAAWIMAQVADLFFPALNLPEWTVTFVIALLVLGFPITMLLAWAFDVTPKGVEVTPDAAPAATTRKALFVFSTLMIGGTALLVFLLYGWPLSQKTDPDSAGTGIEAPALDKSIAVLPFDNFSDSKEDEYFSDGLADTLLHRLAQIRDLKVTARNSSFFYKGRNEDIRVVGEQLGVATVLEGSVQRYGDQVRIIAQLIDTSDGSHIWSQTYDRTLNDIFKIHDEISQSVVDALKVTLLQNEQERLVRHSTENIRAHERYLAALSLYYGGQGGEMLRSLELLQQAVDEDPGYSDAYSQIGLVYSGLAFRTSSAEEFEEFVQKGNRAAEYALQLNPESASAYTAIGELQRRQGKVKEAFVNLQKAIDLSPNDARAWQLAGLALLDQPGKVEQALDYQLRARELNTQSRYLLRQISYSYNTMGRFDKEFETLQAALELHPQATLYFSDMGRYHLGVTGRLDLAMRWIGDGLRINPTHVDAGVPISAHLVVGNAFIGDMMAAGAWQRHLEQEAAGSNAARAYRVFLNNWKGDHVTAAQLANEILEDSEQRFAFNYESPFLTVADAFMMNGEYDRAIEMWLIVMPEFASADTYVAAFERSYLASRIALNLARAYRLSGMQQKSEQLLAALMRTPDSLKGSGPFTWYGTHSTNYLDAEISAFAGETENALAALEQVLELADDGYYAIGSLPVPIAESPYFEAIRDNPRFQFFVEEIRRRKGVARQRATQLDLPDV